MRRLERAKQEATKANAETDRVDAEERMPQAGQEDWQARLLPLLASMSQELERMFD